VADGDKGDITVSSSGTVWAIDNGAVTNSKFRNSNGLTVVGRSANSSGAVADISAGTDGHVLRRSGTTLGFGQIVAAGIANNAVLYSRMQLVSSQDRLLGRVSGSNASVAEITPAEIYTMLNIVGTANRIAYFAGANAITTSSDLTFSSSRLGSKQVINLTNLYSGTNVAFDTGAGTGPTTDSITGGGNWIAFTFTTGTSPAASATVASASGSCPRAPS
jgi:hypothetical protein